MYAQSLNSQHIDYAAVLKTFCRSLTLPRGSMLQKDWIYYLQSGFCAMSYLTRTGEQASFIYFRPGMLLNFMPELSKRMYFCSITQHRRKQIAPIFICKTKCQFLAAPASTFLQSVGKDTNLYSLIQTALAENMISLLGISIDLATCSATERLCKLLYESLPDNPPYVVPSFLTYAEIASYLSLHEITVTKIFRAISTQGILRKQGRTNIIINRDRLERIGDGLEQLIY